MEFSMKHIKPICAVLATISFVLSLTACSGQDVIIAGIDQNQVPLSFNDSAGSLSGFEIDLATEAAKRAGLTVTFKHINWNNKVRELRAKNVNSLWGKLTLNDTEKSDMLFTNEYFLNKQIILVLKDSIIKSSGDLQNKSLGALTGSQAASSLKDSDITAKLNGGQITFFDDYDTQFLALDSGQIDAVAMDQTMADYYINAHTIKYKVLSDVLSQEKFVIGFRRNDSKFRNLIQNSLDSMAADGSTERLSTKWFNENLTINK